MRKAFVCTLFLAAVAAGCASHVSPASFVPGNDSVRRDAARHPRLTDAQVVQNAVNEALAALPAPTAPGMAIGVYYNGNPYYYYQGVQNIGGTAVNANTIFELGSITKSFTALLLADAIDRGVHRVTLNDAPAPIMKIPGLPNATAPDPVATSCPVPTATPVPKSAYGTVKYMTLFELLTHTSGLPDGIKGTYGTPIGRQCFSSQMFVNYIESGTFAHPPAPWLYSDIGFGTLGYVLEGLYTKNGKTPYWITIADENLINPLGMKHTYDLDIPKSQLANYAVGYVSGKSGSWNRARHWEWDAWPSAGVLRSTAPDMMTYIKLVMGVAGPPNMLNAAELATRPFVNGSKGAQGLAFQMTPVFKRPASPAPSASPLPPGRPPLIVWKDGATGGFGSWIGVLRKGSVKSPMGIVLLFNSGNKHAGIEAMGQQVLQTLYLGQVETNARR